jgi:hypothetical protein
VVVALHSTFGKSRKRSGFYADPLLNFPRDVLECAQDGGFIVSTGDTTNLITLSRDGVKLGVLGKRGIGNNRAITYSTALAALPGGAMLVRHDDGSRCSIIRDHCHRLQWMGVCVSAALV